MKPYAPNTSLVLWDKLLGSQSAPNESARTEMVDISDIQSSGISTGSGGNWHSK